MAQSPEEIMESAWRSFYPQVSKNMFNITIANKFPLTQYMENSDISILHVNLAGGSLNYVSDNIGDVIGANKSDLLQKGITQLLKHLIPSHLEYSIVVTSLYKDVFSQWNANEILNMRLTIVGLRIDNHEKGEIAILNNGIPVNWDVNNLATENMNMLQDITHLMKNEHYWIRIWTTANSETVKNYHSNPNFNIGEDILSKREKQILKLIIKEQPAIKIAKDLKISLNTVNNHRQKILDKFGVKDTTALISLAKLINFNQW